jgi:hypothetical protein
MGTNLPAAASAGVTGVNTALAGAGASTTPLQTAIDKANLTMATGMPQAAKEAAAGMGSYQVPMAATLEPTKEAAQAVADTLNKEIPAGAKTATANVVASADTMTGSMKPPTDAVADLTKELEAPPKTAKTSAKDVNKSTQSMDDQFVDFNATMDSVIKKMKELEKAGSDYLKAWSSLDWNILWKSFSTWATSTWAKVSDTLLAPFKDFKKRLASEMGGGTITVPTIHVNVPMTINRVAKYTGAPPPTSPVHGNPALGGPPRSAAAANRSIGTGLQGLSRSVSRQLEDEYSAIEVPSITDGVGPLNLRAGTGLDVNYTASGSGLSDVINGGFVHRDASAETGLSVRDQEFLHLMRRELEAMRTTTGDIKVYIGETELTHLVQRVQIGREVDVSRQLTRGRSGF